MINEKDYEFLITEYKEYDTEFKKTAPEEYSKMINKIKDFNQGEDAYKTIIANLEDLNESSGGGHLELAILKSKFDRLLNEIILRYYLCEKSLCKFHDTSTEIKGRRYTSEITKREVEDVFNAYKNSIEENLLCYTSSLEELDKIFEHFRETFIRQIEFISDYGFEKRREDDEGVKENDYGN